MEITVTLDFFPPLWQVSIQTGYQYQQLSWMINLIWDFGEMRFWRLINQHWKGASLKWEYTWPLREMTTILSNMNFHECDRQSTSLWVDKLGISTAAKLSIEGALIRAFRCLFSPSGAVEHHNEEHFGLSSHVCPSWVGRCCPWPRSDCGTGATTTI